MSGASQKIIKDTTYLLGSTIGGRIFGSIAGIVTARFLGPSDFGLLKIINFIPTLSKYGGFGFASVAKREIPHYRLKKETDSKLEKKIKNVSYSADILWSILLVAIVFISSFYYSRPEIRIGLWIVSLTLFIKSVEKLFSTETIINKNFSIIAYISFISSVITSITILFTIYWGGIYSVLIAGLLGSIVSIIIFWRKIKLNFLFYIEKDELFRQIKIALPLAGGTLAYGLFGWVQRIEVSILFGNVILGNYMLIILILHSIFMFTNTIFRASSIELYERLANNEDNNKSTSLILIPSKILCFILPFLGGVIWLAGPFIIKVLLPDYTLSIKMFPYLIPILVLENTSVMARTAMTSAAINMQTDVVILRMISIFVFASVTYYLGYKLSYSIESAIIGRASASFVLFIGTFIFTSNYLFNSIKEMLKTIIEILFPLILVTSICLFLISFLGVESIEIVLLNVLILFAIISPMSYIYFKKLGFIKLFKTILNKS